MAETNEENQNSEKSDDGGETGKQKTTEKTPEELRQIAEDQRKRAEKAEADLKAERQKNAKPKDEKPVGDQNKINAQSPDPDELRLIAKGLSDTEIEQARVISKGKGISLMESLKDPLFISFQKDLKEQEKKEKAKLGGSNSSNQGQQGDEPVVRSGMTAEEHKAAWEKTMKG